MGEGKHSTFADIHVEGYRKPLRITLSGDVTAQWPMGIDLGEFLNSQTQSYHGKIFDREKRIVILELRYNSTHFEVTYARAQDGVEFVVKTKPPIPVGKIHDTIEFVTDDEWFPVKTTQIEGEAYPKIEANPAIISLGTFSPDNLPITYVEFRSRAGVKFHVTSVKTNQEFLEAHLQEEGALARTGIQVSKKAPVGPITGSLIAFTDDDDIKQITVPIYGLLKKNQE